MDGDVVRRNLLLDAIIPVTQWVGPCGVDWTSLNEEDMRCCLLSGQRRVADQTKLPPSPW